MKKITKAKSLHAFLLTGVLLAACSNDDSVTEQRNVLEAGKTYYMSVEATKGSDEDAARATRALTYSNGELHSSWSTIDDYVYLVYNNNDPNVVFNGYLQPQSNGSTTKLNGDVEPNNTVSLPIDVTLIFPRKDWDYTGQVGTISDIDAKYDYATTTEPVKIYSVTANEIDNASKQVFFQKEQAIVQFTLFNKDNNDAALNPSSLRISASGLKTGETETGDITITPAGNTNVIYAALRGISGAQVILTATVGNDTYICRKDNVTFAHGHYYPITVKMHEVTYPVELTAVNNEDYIGSVVGTDGKVYAKASDVPGPYSAVAMIAYVGTGSNCTHGLAVALTDESADPMTQSNAKTAASTTKNSNTPVVNGTWRLPTVLDWKNMFKGCGGIEDDGAVGCSAFNAKLKTVRLELSSSWYWTSSNNYTCLSITNGWATFPADQNGEFSTHYVRAVLSF